jgi:AraC-like DNA-binding protein
MTKSVKHGTTTRLERSCVPARGDWILHAPAQAGIERLEAFFQGHAYDPHRHDTYALGYTMSGIQTFIYRGGRADSRRGDVMILHPDEVHDGRAGAKQGFRYRMAYIEPRLIASALRGKTNALPFIESAVSSEPHLLHALRAALADLDHTLEPLECDKIIAAIADTLLALDTSLPARAVTATSAQAVDLARGFLHENFMRTVASEELEAVTGLDRYALARHFRIRLGTSPYRYLTMRRLDRAKSAIISGHSLAEAAFMSGFADQSHMTRQFKHAFGLTPGHWHAIHLRDGP